MVGEFVINISIKFMLDQNVYRLIKNVTIKTSDGTTQIDHILVSKFGIFVIETKNYAGWIFGDPKQKMWTQKIFKKTSKFQNPLHQNYKHTKTLEESLGLPSDKVLSLIVFVGDSTFKTPMPDNVVQSGQFLQFIKSKTDILFSDIEVSNITTRIQNICLNPSFSVHREHVRHVNNIVNLKRKKETVKLTPRCPKCERELLVKTMNEEGIDQKYWSCSGHPECLFSYKLLP